ncbi:MAG TPA: VOC family protein [Candidatus Acidoferrales bacterium]|nr:VOC family protein [Candidatus Acidoferrales bacterium]
MSAEFRGRFDHAVILVADLARASETFTKLGFDVSPGGSHTGLGTHNALIRFGVDYLELLAVRDEAEALRARSSTSSVVERIRSGNGGLASFALATADIERDAARFRERGLSAVGPFAMERMRPDGHKLSWRLLVPNGESWGKPWPFFIQWDQDDATRLSWERSGPQPNGARRVVAVSVAVNDLDAAAALYEGTIGLHASGDKTGPAAHRRTFTTDSFAVHLYGANGPGWAADRLRRHGEGIFEISLATSGKLETVTAEGARIEFVSDAR